VSRHSEVCDVAVVGGGMVGATLACILARAGIRTVLLEGRPPVREWSENTTDLRVSALTMASRTVLDTLGVWPSIAARRAEAYRFMKVWDGDFGGQLFFDGADIGHDVLGYIVENRVSVAALWDFLENLSDARLLCPARVAGLESAEDGCTLSLEDGNSVLAGLVVAADGGESAVRSMAGMNVKGWGYRQAALVATVETGESHNETAYQRFLPQGPLAFLPVGKNLSSIVWTSDTDTTRGYLEMPESRFIEELEHASAGLLGSLALAGKRASFPLKLQYAPDYFRERVVLVGDSAHTVHPLAGQGANLGILDAAALAELVVAARASGRPISGASTLRRYERWRKGDNMAMMMSMDLLDRFFVRFPQGFGHLRSMGMNVIDKTGPLKNFFNRYAIGLRGDLPALAYGKACW